MTHFPGHLRNALRDWIASGFPEQAVCEEDYVERHLDSDDFLCRFVEPTCTDTLPKESRELVRVHLGLDAPDYGMSYGIAACALLVASIGGKQLGADFLRKLWSIDE